MNIQKQTYPIQTLPTGETYCINAYVCTSGISGPTVYLQANLHGAEVFGTYMLMDLLEKMKEKTFPGKVIIIPIANPMAVNTNGYNGISGRWNPENGTNWNRIFPTNKQFNNKQDCKEFFEKELTQDGLSVEQTLAYTLQCISAPADYLIDIHTTGTACEPHLFTHKHAHNTFSPLHCNVHIEWDKDSAIGAFDESCVLRFPSKNIQACTWEVYHHNAIHEETKNLRVQELTNCLESIWRDKQCLYEGKIKHINDTAHLHAPVAGYYLFTKPVGAHIQKGEQYAMVYQPWNNQKKQVSAEEQFILLGTYGTYAIAKGGQIGFIAKN